MDQVKLAFQKVKQEMDSLKEEVDFLKQSFLDSQQKFLELESVLESINQNLIFLREDSVENVRKNANSQSENNPTDPQIIPAHPVINPTDQQTDPAHNYPFKPLKEERYYYSTGNEEVPADKQTNQQTNQQTNFPSINSALGVLDSLDSLRKEIKQKFRDITEQEFLVFSTIYQLEEEQEVVDYRSLALKLNLTESSIRDYIGKLIKKGIPLEKEKINNKTIHLSISENFKKIAPLPVLFQLRSL